MQTDFRDIAKAMGENIDGLIHNGGRKKSRRSHQTAKQPGRNPTEFKKLRG